MRILCAMSGRIATPLGRDLKKINLFSAQFLRVKIGRDFVCKGLRGSSRTQHQTLPHSIGHQQSESCFLPQPRPPISLILQPAPSTSQNTGLCHHTSITPSFVTTTERDSSRSTTITLFTMHTPKRNRKERSKSLFHPMEIAIPTSPPNIHQYF